MEDLVTVPPQPGLGSVLTGHGQLTDEEGPPSFTDTDAAVVGGTGRYQNASGSAHLTSVNITTQTYQWDHELYGVAPS